MATPKYDHDPLLAVISNPLASSRPNVVQDACQWQSQQLTIRVEHLERENRQLKGSNDKLRHANKHYRSKIEALEVENKEFHDRDLRRAEKYQDMGREIDRISHEAAASKEKKRGLREQLAAAQAIREKQERKISHVKEKCDQKINKLNDKWNARLGQAQAEIAKLKDMLELASMAHEDQEKKLTRFETSYEGLQGQLETLAFRSRMHQSESVKEASSVSDKLDEILLGHR